MAQKPFKDVTLKDQLTLDKAEHEVFMSFNNDQDAVDFEEWWEDDGRFAFQKWIDENRKE